MISETCMTSSNAATRGITFLKREVAGATMASSEGASATRSEAPGLRCFVEVEMGEAIDALVGGILVGARLLLRLHDVGKARIARLVQPQVRGDDRRPLQLDGLQAAIDFTCHLEIGAVDFELGGKGRLRPAKQRGQHLAGLVTVVVDRLLAKDDKARL